MCENYFKMHPLHYSLAAPCHSQSVTRRGSEEALHQIELTGSTDRHAALADQHNQVGTGTDARERNFDEDSLVRPIIQPPNRVRRNLHHII